MWHHCQEQDDAECISVKLGNSTINVDNYKSQLKHKVNLHSLYAA